MLNIIKQSFNLTNKYIVLASPLILFSLISSLYLLFSTNRFGLNIIFAICLFTLMFAAFISGWFNMIARILRDDEIDPNTLFIEFPSGVGEYFLPVIGMLIIVFTAVLVIIFGTYAFGMKTIGNIGISHLALTNALNSPSELKTFLMTLSNEQLIKLNAWNLLLFFSMLFTYFLMMFYSPALFLISKNPFKSFFWSIKHLFGRKFLNNLLLYVVIFVTYLIISILTIGLGNNIIIHFIFTLINFYYIVFVAILVFNYYYLNYAKIGSNIDTKI